MKVLITEGTSYYLVDLEQIKPMSLREVLLASGDSELITLNVADQNVTNLDDLLVEALRVRVSQYPSPVRPTTRTPRTSAVEAPEGSKRTPEELQAIREWARANGHEVADKGRIKAEIIEAYEAQK